MGIELNILKQECYLEKRRYRATDEEQGFDPLNRMR